MADCVILAYALLEEIDVSASAGRHPNIVKDLFERSIHLSRELEIYIKVVMREPEHKAEAAKLLLLQSRLIRKISLLNRGWRRSLVEIRDLA